MSIVELTSAVRTVEAAPCDNGLIVATDALHCLARFVFSQYFEC